MVTTDITALPTITRAEHNARMERGEKASGIYAYVFLSMDGVKHVMDLRDENDEQIDFGSTHMGALMARVAAKRADATFIVEEF